MKKLRSIFCFVFTFITSAVMACEINPIQFQLDALAFLKHEYPNQQFKLGKNVDVIEMGKVELGLPNLRSKLCITNAVSNAKRKEAEMRSHFQAMMQLLEVREPKMPQTWAMAKGSVYVQLMPSDYLQSFGGAHVLVSRPFIPGVELAVVLDRKDGYDYVRDEDRVRWSITEKVLFETALSNLTNKKGDVKLQGGGDPDRFLAVEEKDGYDAVRLVVPWIKQEAAKFLGDPFLVSVPNRDFLIMWSEKNSAKFQAFTKEKVREDFDAQPYPLSPTTWRVWANGRIEAVR